MSTGAFNGCEKDQKTFWFSDFVLLKRHTVLLQQLKGVQRFKQVCERGSIFQ